MPEIPEYYRRGKLQDRAVGGMPVYSPVAERTKEEAGSVLTQFGLNVLEQYKKAEAVDQFNNFQAQTLGEIQGYMNGLDPTQDTKDWEKGMDDLLMKRRNEGVPALSNSDARQNAEMWMRTREVGWKNDVFWSARKAKIGQMSANMQKNVNFYMKGAIEAPNDAVFEENMALLHDEIYSRTTIDEEGDINLLSKEEADLEWQTLQEKVKEEREKFKKDAEVKVYKGAEDHYFEYLTDPEKGFDEKEAVAAASKLKTEEIGDRREELTTRLRNYFAAKESQEKKVVDAFKRDVSARRDKASILELTELHEEVLTNGDISYEEQETLVKRIQDRIEYLKKGSNVISVPGLAKRLSREAINVDPDSPEYDELLEEINKHEQDGNLHPEDAEDIRLDALTKYNDAQKVSLQYGYDGADDLVQPLQLMDKTEWIFDQKAKGRSDKWFGTDEAKNAFVQFVADQAIQADRRALEKDLARYAKSAMRDYYNKHNEEAPSVLQKEYDRILWEYRRLRESGRGAMEFWRMKESGVMREAEPMTKEKAKSLLDEYELMTGGKLNGKERTGAIALMMGSTPKGKMKEEEAGLQKPPVASTIKSKSSAELARELTAGITDNERKLVAASGYNGITDDVWNKYSEDEVKRYLNLAKNGYFLRVKDGRIQWLAPK